MRNDKVKLAVVGVGNNISALVQGVYLYQKKYEEANNASMNFPGVSLEQIGGLKVTDIEFVAAIDVNENKVNKDISKAIFAEPNNYPKLDVELNDLGVPVYPGVTLDGIPDHLLDNCKGIKQSEESDKDKIVKYLIDSGAEVLLYSLPTNSKQCANFYSECSLEAGVAFVNCTPDIVGRNETLINAYRERGVPLLGDDLASQIGSSILQREILQLLTKRGLNLTEAYQINVGGNTDFKNLMVNGHLKNESKKNALSGEMINTDLIEVIPSAGVLKQLNDQKVCFMSMSAQGWGYTPITIDLKLVVQDSSNAAGVIIDLVRIAALARRNKMGGFIDCAAYFLKSPSRNKGKGNIDEVKEWEKTLINN
jgi:myo-inositol-1-phosphate synthase